MFGKPSLMTRIVIGKSIGFLIGLAAFIFLPRFLPDVEMITRWGLLLWYTTFGAIIGVFGVFNYHPLFKLPLPWWVRSPVLGAWLNFVLTFFAYDVMQAMLNNWLGEDSVFNSPFWFVLEGAVIGLIIGFFATKYGGEGKETVGK